ncbi:hypothetical protein TWF718_006243 [Orbilia javanica]|uniref:Uncharacterized protein n=1 Tax=Orbilia javanica TaxID=47235 RepID=A0AAN8N955_9PEZI
MQEAHAMPLTSASLSLLQKGHRKRGFDHVASYVAEQAAYPPEQSGDENVETGNPASPRKSSIILLGKEAAGLSRSAAQGHIQPKETRSRCDRGSDESPGPALTLIAKTVSRKRQCYDSSLISPIKENSAEDGIRYGSETTYVSWSTSPARRPADTSQLTAAREEVFEKRKRHRMHDSRQKPAIAKTSRKKEKHRENKEKKNKEREPRIPQPAFGALASSAVESEHLSGARLTMRPQIATGLFHKGRVSGLQSRAALPDLTFCEMDFLRNGVPEGRRMQQTEGGANDKGKRRRERGTNEEISSFFKKAGSPLGKENTSPLSSRARHHAALLDMQDKSSQAGTHPRHYATASHCNLLSRDSQRNNARHPLEKTSHPPSYMQSSPHQSKTSTSTPAYLAPHSERPIFGSFALDSPGNVHSSHPQATSSEMGNPIVTWLKRTAREYPKEQENDLCDRRSYLCSSVREFNGLSCGPNPHSPRIFSNSPANRANTEKDTGVGERTTAHPDEGVVTGDPPCVASRLDSGFMFGRSPNDYRILDNGPSFYQIDPPVSKNEHLHTPSEPAYWGDQLGTVWASVDNPRYRNGEAEATSPYYNNRGSVVEESDYQTTCNMKFNDQAADAHDHYSDFGTNIEDHGKYNSGTLDEFATGGPVPGEKTHIEFQSEQVRNQRDNASDMPQLGPKNFWRPHRLY